MGSVNCCDNHTQKNCEILQSITHRESLEDILFSSNLLHLPKSDFSVSNSRVKKLEKLKPRKKLILESPSFPDQDLEIHPLGLENSSRQIKDGYVFFGCKLKERGEIVNDAKIKIRSKSKEFIGRCFCIFFKLKTESFWIKDLGKGPGVFIKLDFPLVMKDGMIINIGGSFLSFKFKTKIISNPEVEIRKFGDPNFLIELSASDCLNGVNFGRGQNCLIKVQDESLSKNHAVLKFNLSSGWVLQDGDAKGTPSTNGTWLYANEEFEIYEGFFFKFSHTLFKASFNNC